MSFSFQQFISTLSGNNGQQPQVSDGNMSINDSAIDLSGGYSPVFICDANGKSQIVSDSLSISKSSEDSPGTNPCDTSLANAPLVFSKAEEFISATLSNVKIGSGAGATTSGVSLPTQNSSELADNKSINFITKSDSIKVEEYSTHTALNHLIGNKTSTTENNTNADSEENTILSQRETNNDNETEVEGGTVDSKSALKRPYIENKENVTSNNRSNSVSDNSNKMWREGMDKQAGESSKTVFITQNLTERYDKADAEIKGVTYKACASKITREITYFGKILNVIGADLRNTEYTMDGDSVLATRERIKEKVVNLKDALDKFVSESLQGDVRDKPPVIQEPAAKIRVEYVHPPEKKSAKEAKAELCLENVDVANSLHKCADCGSYITIDVGESLEAALEKHSNLPKHKAMANSGDQSAVTVSKQQKLESNRRAMEKEVKEKAENNKKALEKVPRQNVLNHTQSRQMMLNQITSQVVNGQIMLTCNPCGDVIPVDGFTSHVNTNIHKDNLNNFNMRLQKDLILKYPDLFGPGKIYHLTDLHIVVNKIFVDPLAKYSYCGLCRKELPSKQMNIDEHITSKNHEKFLEGRVSIVKQKDIDQVLSSAKTRNIESSNADSDGIDIINIVKQRNQQDRRSSGSIQPYHELEEKDKIYGATSMDGKFVCLLCDARGITSLQNLISHFHGGPHKTNLEHSKQVRGGLDPDVQILFVKNMISVTYGRFPLIFECFACHATPFAGVQIAMDHINSENHLTMLTQKQLQQKTQHLKIDRNESRKSNVITNVILHRNCVNFWCLSCRCELIDISSAYRHVLLPGHLTASVDGVLMLQGTQFYCEHCGVLISGEKNVGFHIVSQKHRQQVPANKTNSQESKTPPSYSRAQAKKLEDERNGNKSSADEVKLKVEERMLLHKNFVNIKKNLFQCKLCDSEQMTRSNILTHIFSYEHTLKMQSQIN